MHPLPLGPEPLQLIPADVRCPITPMTSFRSGIHSISPGSISRPASSIRSTSFRSYRSSSLAPSISTSLPADRSSSPSRPTEL
ncbi:hypothetical protein Pst134EA_014938 [Puccinia striiformis f. sp. tritici]|uniref:hypothetical protein n=1 Tax=Puccinia striiformis f. sp. tritici TaxID=168172 RepID=UPI0020076416|nr:hypothetical protein Pst134EA_014938 [Puccinia striiformis f. sp. tritici]KAH9462847.1 hypothetical protein Pst134EA_014938 [Puccinia striiformis f. sp. tritici]